jgi:hypothetical protein
LKEVNPQIETRNPNLRDIRGGIYSIVAADAYRFLDSSNREGLWEWTDEGEEGDESSMGEDPEEEEREGDREEDREEGGEEGKEEEEEPSDSEIVVDEID